jgi:NUMOD4 motif-containing protein
MIEQWKTISHFPDYSVSDHGNVRSDKTGRLLALNENQFGVLQVGMMRDGEQKHRSVPLLVAKAFIPQPPGPFDTPINLDGNRRNNHADNLVWRPRWFAIKYNRQFRHPYESPILYPIEDIKTGEVSENSIECAKRYGLLEEDLVQSILTRTFVWPTYQEFRVIGNSTDQLTLDID